MLSALSSLHKINVSTTRLCCLKLPEQLLSVLTQLKTDTLTCKADCTTDTYWTLQLLVLVNQMVMTGA